MKVLKNTLIIALLVATMFSFSGCGQKKKSITSSEFQSVMKSKNYIVQDGKSQYASYPEITECYLSAPTDRSFTIEFYVLDSDSSAQGMFAKNKSIFEEAKNSSKTRAESSISLANYAKYTLKVDDKYKVVSRIDNTLIYVDAPVKSKDEVSNILESLGY
ncbi:MAG: hypothetical protein IKE01_05165 [Clostridia bacterium]|nr:hypothetical protein [Clostridia bacterium]